MKHYVYCAAALLICWVSIAHAQSERHVAHRLSLADVLEAALKNNPRYAAARSAVAAAGGYTRQAGLWKNPDLFFETVEWPVEESFNDSRYKLGISQTIPFPGKKSLEQRAAKKAQSEAEAGWRANRAELVKRVRIEFYRALLFKRVLEIGAKLSEVALSSVDTAKERLAAGASTAQEVLRAEIQYERVKSDRTQYERDYRTARSRLAVLLGRPEHAEFVLLGTLRVAASKELLRSQDLSWLDKHPLVIAAEAEVGRVRAELERVSLEPYPDVTFSLSGGRREVNDETLVDFGLSLPLPLIDSSKGNREAAAALLRKAEAELLQTRQSLQGRLEQWTHALTQLNEQVASYRTALLPRAEKALAMAQTGFKEGEYGFNDLLDTQRTTAEMRLLYQEKLFDLNRAIAEVESLVKPNELFVE